MLEAASQEGIDVRDLFTLDVGGGLICNHPFMTVEATFNQKPSVFSPYITPRVQPLRPALARARYPWPSTNATAILSLTFSIKLATEKRNKMW